MIDKCHDPEDVVRDILAAGPVPAPKFRELCHQRGLTWRMIPKAAKAVGATCCRSGAPGAGGWVYMLNRPLDAFIKTFPNRKGYYANNLFRDGVEVQVKLADDLDTARIKVAALVADIKAEKAARTRISKGNPGKRANRPVADELRDIARSLLKLIRRVETLERNSP